MSSDDIIDPVLANAHAHGFLVSIFKKACIVLYPKELIQPAGESSTAQLKSCILQLRNRITSAEELDRLAAYLDVPPAPDIDGVLQKIIASVQLNQTNPKGPPPKSKTIPISSIDDLTPNQFKRAVHTVAKQAARKGKIVDMTMPAFLRACLKTVFASESLEGRFNVGPNRHFTRMFQWLSEVAEDTRWSDGQGLKIVNVRGPVAAYPSDPKRLKIKLDRDYLPSP